MMGNGVFETEVLKDRRRAGERERDGGARERIKIKKIGSSQKSELVRSRSVL